jgi:hypothetical protein
MYDNGSFGRAIILKTIENDMIMAEKEQNTTTRRAYRLITKPTKRAQTTALRWAMIDWQVERIDSELISIMDVFELSETELRSATGLSRDVFIYIYTTYCGPHTIINTPLKLYELYVYFKTYPIQDTFFLSFGKHNKGRFIQRLHDRARHLASGIFINDIMKSSSLFYVEICTDFCNTINNCANVK